MYQTKQPSFKLLLPNTFNKAQIDNKFRTIGQIKAIIPNKIYNKFRNESKEKNLNNFNFIYNNFINFYKNIFDNKKEHEIIDEWFEFGLDFILIIAFEGYGIIIDLELVDNEFKLELMNKYGKNDKEIFKDYIVEYNNKVLLCPYVTAMGEVKILYDNIYVLECFIINTIKKFNPIVFKDLENVIYNIQNDNRFEESDDDIEEEKIIKDENN